MRSTGIATKHFPADVIRETGPLGLGGIYVRDDVGGSALGRLDAVLIFEALSRADPAFSSFISIHNMAAWMIDRFGNDEQRQRFLPKLTSMEWLASYCLTEPGSGSDAAALKTRAVQERRRLCAQRRQAVHLRRRRQRCLCRHGAHRRRRAERHFHLRRAEGRARPLLRRQRAQDGLAHAVDPPGHLRGLQACRRKTSCRREGAGFGIAMAGLDGGRLNIAACSLGGAQSALDKALAYTAERKAFGSKINEFQALQFRLADMETELQAARIFLYAAASKLDAQGAGRRQWSAMAKRFVTDTGFNVANDALQLLGGYGYLHDYGIEKLVRDLRVHQILEGTNEIMRVIIARALIGR